MSRGEQMLMLSLNKRLKTVHHATHDIQSSVDAVHRRTPSNSDTSVPSHGEQSYRPHTESKSPRPAQVQASKTVKSKEKCHHLQCSDRQKAAMVVPGIQPNSDNTLHAGASSNNSVSALPVVSSDEPASGCNTETKKRRPRTSAAQTAESKEKHPMLPPCSATCRRKCSQKISASRRADIHKQFWMNLYDARRMWMYNHLHRVPVQRRRPAAAGEDISRRQPRESSYLFKLPAEDGSDVFVCKTFFLHTLGYKSDKVLTCLMHSCAANVLSPAPSKRGKHKPSNAVDETVIVSHINSFNPQISHYRRKHAPRRRYLAPEITVKSMFADFISK